MASSPKQPGKMPPWPEPTKKENSCTRKHSNFRSVVKRCNQNAWTKTYRVQATAEYWDEEYALPDPYMELPLWTRLLRHGIALFILLPLTLIISLSLCEQLTKATDPMGILFSIPVWYTLLGAIVWIILGSSKLVSTSLLYTYIFGHELTHAIAVYCSRGRVSDFSTSLDGGYIQTNKNNLFIALSPYFIPIYGVIWAILAGIVYYFYPSYTCEALLYAGLGFWWAFHLFWTAWMIPKDQSDLSENGVFFSLLLIYLINQLLFLIFMGIFKVIDIPQFFSDCVTNTRTLWFLVKDFFFFLCGLFS